MKLIETQEEQQISPAHNAANDLKAVIKAHWLQMKATQLKCFNLFWRNTKASPQEIADALGSEASEVFVLGADLAGLILKYEPAFPESGWKPLVNPTFRKDGTVSVTAPVVPDEEPTPEPEPDVEPEQETSGNEQPAQPEAEPQTPIEHAVKEPVASGPRPNS